MARAQRQVNGGAPSQVKMVMANIYDPFTNPKPPMGKKKVAKRKKISAVHQHVRPQWVEDIDYQNQAAHDFISNELDIQNAHHEVMI